MNTGLQGQVDILFFRVGQTRYGVDATQVRRIDRARGAASNRHVLGAPKEGTRALVFEGPSGEASLPIDEVEGVRPVRVADLRRVPAAAGRVRCVVGFWLDEAERPTVLVDLPQTLDGPGVS